MSGIYAAASPLLKSRRVNLRKRHDRGFSILELAVVLSIVGIVSALVLSGVGGVKKRGNYNSATGDFITNLRKTRAASFGRGNPTVFIVDSAGGRYWGIEDVGGAFSLDAFNPATPAVAPQVLVTSGTLPLGVTFAPSNGYGAALPAPYTVILANVACTFCRTSGVNTGFGAVTFQASGGADFFEGIR
jgi:prepilin-type N-terminal cleavage/methylation domain-containing protein